MEIKRQLTALGKRMTPQVETMNVAVEIRGLVKRIDELVTYAQTKIDRSAERKETIGRRVQREKEDAAAKIAVEQDREANENQVDQEIPSIPPVEAVSSDEVFDKIQDKAGLKSKKKNK